MMLSLKFWPTSKASKYANDHKFCCTGGWLICMCPDEMVVNKYVVVQGIWYRIFFAVIFPKPWEDII